MPRYRESLSSFLNGEISPKAYGRTDIQQYKQSCEKIRNAIVYPQGGAGRRPGSQFKAALADTVTDTIAITKAFTAGTFTGGTVKLVPFVISESESYLVVLGVGQGVAGDDGLPVLVYNANDLTQVWIPRNNSNIGSFQNGADTKPRWLPTGKDPITIQHVQRGNVLFLTSEYMMPFCIEYTGDFTQSIGGANGGPFVLRALEMFSHLGKYPSITSTTGEVFARSVPYEAVNTDAAKTVTLSADAAETNLITITCSAAGIITPAMVGCFFKVSNSVGSPPGATTTGLYKIYAYNTGTNVASARIFRVGGGTAATSFWARAQWFSANPGSAGPAFSDALNEGARWWPRSCTFFENRLCFGGTTAYPATIWGSTQGNAANFKIQKYINDASLVITNDMAFEFEIAATENASIRWMSAAKTLQIGTLSREYVAFGPDQAVSLGPTNVKVTAESSHGSMLVQPVRSENALIYVQRSGKKVRELTFNFAEDSYKSSDLTLFAEHIANLTDESRTTDLVANPRRSDGAIVQIALQEIPSGVTWMLDDLGGLIGLTRNRELGVAAFHHHQIAGPGPTGARGITSIGSGGATITITKVKTGLAEVKSICPLPSVGAVNDDLWMAVRRTLPAGFGSTEVCYLEKIGKDFAMLDIPSSSASISADEQFQLIYCDSARVIYNAGGTVTVPDPSLTYGYGVDIVIIGDGKYLGVFNTGEGGGDITLDASYKSIVYGYNYDSVIIPLNIEAGAAIGTSQGAMKRVDEINIRFNRTVGAKFGPSESELQDIDFRPATLQDDAIPLFSGDQTLKFRGGHNRRSYVVIKQSLPLPFQVTSIVARLLEND